MFTTSATKRALDLGIALALLPIALPLCLLAMIAIRLETPGPPLFIQQRVGRAKRPFRLLKLRTMAQGTGDRPSHEVGSAQVTRVGATLRRTKLDELPQLWNVLTGAMSLVGPRPCLPSQHQLVAERDARGVYELRPGVTGHAQLRGIDMSEPVRLAIADAEYHTSASLRNDVRILLRTALGGGRGDAVKF